MPVKLEEFIKSLSDQEADELWEWLSIDDSLISAVLEMQLTILDSHPEIS